MTINISHSLQNSHNYLRFFCFSLKMLSTHLQQKKICTIKCDDQKRIYIFCHVKIMSINNEDKKRNKSNPTESRNIKIKRIRVIHYVTLDFNVRNIVTVNIYNIYLRVHICNVTLISLRACFVYRVHRSAQRLSTIGSVR